MAETVSMNKLTLKQQRDALREGRIMGFECGKCKHRTQTPMVGCVKCGSSDIKVVEFANQGKVVTYTIQSVASEQFLNEVPFAWVIVELDNGGPHVSGWVAFVSKPADLPIGQRVKFVSSYKPGMMFEKL